MGPSLVIYTTIVFDHDPRLCRGPQLLAVQTFVAEASVKALHIEGPRRSTLRLVGRDAQTLGTTQPRDLSFAHVQTFLAQQRGNPPIPVARMLFGQLL